MAENKKIEKPEYSNFKVYIRMEPYLAQWLAHKFGPFPIRFPKGSIENDIMEKGLIPLPKKATPDLPGKGKYPIILPFFRYKDVRFHNFLPISDKSKLVHCLKVCFDIELWTDLHRFGYIGKQKQDLIWAWMDDHDIDDTEANFNAISKIYARKREAHRRRVKREENEN